MGSSVGRLRLTRDARISDAFSFAPRKRADPDVSSFSGERLPDFLCVMDGEDARGFNVEEVRAFQTNLHGQKLNWTRGAVAGIQVPPLGRLSGRTRRSLIGGFE